MPRQYNPDDVLDWWFPDNGHWTDPERHEAFWFERMQGGMDARICADFADLTCAAARGELDHWATTPRNRLALLIALDQFPRSLWRDTPGAYAQDNKACRLALEGIAKGDIWTLRPWEQIFFVIAISHCEGPDHLERMHALPPVIDRICAAPFMQHEDRAESLRAQNTRVTGIIEKFGRHPHRNPIYGRVSSAAEEAYIAAGDFPHNRRKRA